MKKLTIKRSAFGRSLNYGLVALFFLLFGPLKDIGLITISTTFERQLIPLCAWMVMAVSLCLVVGISGELSLGHAGFMSIGATTAGIFSTALATAIPDDSVRLLLAMVVAAVMAAIFGFLISIPVLRLNGDYLAIVTLAFGEIIKTFLKCFYVNFDQSGLHFRLNDASTMPEGSTAIVAASQGVIKLERISTFLAGVILLIITLIIVQNLVNSRTGRAIMAIRDNRIAAESCGLNATRYKMIAFVIAAALAGAAGALFCLNYPAVKPDKFDYNTSIEVLVFVVLGGMSNITGVMIAAAVLTVLPEILREFNEYRLFIYAVVLILVMIATYNPTIRGWINDRFAALKKFFVKAFTAKKKEAK